MKHKILLCTLFLLVFSNKCSEKACLRQPALSCEISYDDTSIKQLQQLNTYHQLNASIAEYGFKNNKVALTYYEKHGRGVVHISGNILRRLKIPKEQFAKIATIVKNNSSISQLEPNREHPLRDPLYIVAKDTNQYLLYKINSLTRVNPSEIEDAGYSSDIEKYIKLRQKVVSDRKYIFLYGLGIPVGMLMFATGVMIWSKLVTKMFT